MLKQYINLENRLREGVETKMAEDQGEVASWLILAAGLAAAAVAASGELGKIIGKLVEKVASAAGVG